MNVLDEGTDRPFKATGRRFYWSKAKKCSGSFTKSIPFAIIGGRFHFLFLISILKIKTTCFFRPFFLVEVLKIYWKYVVNQSEILKNVAAK